MLLVLSIWSVAIVAFVAGVALCAFKRIRMLETHIREPLQQELEQQQEKLRQIQGARAAHDLFLAGLSHELRTPLSGIQGAVQMLQNSNLNGPQQEYTHMIGYASATVLEIVDDMLTYSRMQAGKIQVERVRFSVRQMIDDMLSLQNIKAQRRGVVLIRDVAADVPADVVGDRGKLNQILLNLIGNALKFTEEGSVTVSVDVVRNSGSTKGTSTDTTAEATADTTASQITGQITGQATDRAAGQATDQALAVTAFRMSDQVWLRFIIRDTGIGIADHEVRHIFEPFVQGQAAHQDGRQGTGLGLTICQRLLHAMNGTIDVDSVPGEGTCVEFQVPLGNTQMPTLAVRSFGQEAQCPVRSLVVLVVEDDEINRLVCTRYLALAGHHPVAVADERQVLHVMAFSGYVPDVVLMDVNLAGQSGVDLARRMRTLEHGRWQEVPVIAMSADVSGSAQAQARDGGIAVFLPKPFSAGQLYTALAATVHDDVGRMHPDSFPDVTSLAVSQQDPERTDIHANELFCRNTQPASSGGMLLDEAWLAEEIEVLGGEMIFELLHLFRASAATTFKAMSDALDRQDWSATADLLHALQGSAANLGMHRVVMQARTLQTMVQVQDDLHPDYLVEQVNQLEMACHASADGVRAMVLAADSQGVALAAHGHD